MSKHEHEHQPEGEEHVEDMDVPEGESEEVKGGLNFSKIEFKNVKLSPNTNLKLDVNQLGDGSV